MKLICVKSGLPKSIVGNLGITAERKSANIYLFSVKPSAPTGETWGSLVYLEVKTCLKCFSRCDNSSTERPEMYVHYSLRDRGVGGGGGRGARAPPPIFLKLYRVSKKKCIVPPPIFSQAPPPPPNLKVAPRSLSLHELLASQST